MAQSVLEMATDLVYELINNHLLAPEDMQQELMKTHAHLLELKTHERQHLHSTPDSAGHTNSTPASIDWKTSIQKHAITCMICGETFKQLSWRHLSHHGLDLQTYRLQFGIPRRQSLAARETTAKRRKTAQRVRPWEKAPTYVQERGTAPARTPTQPMHTRKEEV